MNSITGLVCTVHPNLSKLTLDRKSLFETMWALDILRFDKLIKRIVGEEDTDLFQFIVDIGFMPSKGEIRKLIKNNGLKINNKVVNTFDEIEWIKIDNIEFAVIKKGKGDFDIIFNNFDTSIEYATVS